MDETKQPDWRIIVRFGLVGGAIALYFSAIGMVETFSERNLVGTFLSLGHILLVAGAIGAGLLAARAFKKRSRGAILGAGLAAGAISSILLLLLIAFIQVFVVQRAGQPVVFNVRNMFINFSPGLVAFLTFKRSLLPGSLLLVLLTSLMGGVGAAFTVLPRRWGRGLLSGVAWTLGIGLFSDLVSQVIQGPISQGLFGAAFGRSLVKVLFQAKALNPIAALVVFMITFSVPFFQVPESARTRWENTPAPRQRQGMVIFLLLGIAFLLLIPWFVGLFWSQVFFMVGLYILMGLGLNIVVGFAGLLDLGYVAFFAFGAYTMAILTTTGELAQLSFINNFWLALPFCVLVGVVWGLLLGFPVLRMRGDYLAIVTLGFGEIIRILATSDWLAPIEGGPQGVLFIPKPVIFGFELSNPQTMYYLVILGALLAAFVTIRLRESRLGRQWMAMREDEDVAEAMGINLVQTKLLAFAIGAAFSSLAGGIFAARLGNIFPHTFNLLWSINALALIIVGGLGSIPGVVIGAIILVGLPEALREFAEYRLLMYGLLLIVMMLVRPEGFLPEATRQRELHAGDEEFLEQPVAVPEAGD